MSFADWMWSVIAPALGLKTIPDLLGTNSTHTHTGIAYDHLIGSHSCNYVGYVHHVGHAARRSNNHTWLLGLEYATFSIHEKWINCTDPYRTVIAWRIKYHRPPENTPLGLTLGFHGRVISYKMHSFIQRIYHRSNGDSKPSSITVLRAVWQKPKAEMVLCVRSQSYLIKRIIEK